MSAMRSTVAAALLLAPACAGGLAAAPGAAADCSVSNAPIVGSVVLCSVTCEAGQDMSVAATGALIEIALSCGRDTVGCTDIAGVCPGFSIKATADGQGECRISGFPVAGLALSAACHLS